MQHVYCFGLFSPFPLIVVVFFCYALCHVVWHCLKIKSKWRCWILEKYFTLLPSIWSLLQQIPGILTLHEMWFMYIELDPAIYSSSAPVFPLIISSVPRTPKWSRNQNCKGSLEMVRQTCKQCLTRLWHGIFIFGRCNCGFQTILREKRGRFWHISFCDEDNMERFVQISAGEYLKCQASKDPLKLQKGLSGISVDNKIWREETLSNSAYRSGGIRAGPGSHLKMKVSTWAGLLNITTFLAFILPQQSIDITASHHPLNVRASIPLIHSGQWLKTQLLVCQVFENVLVNIGPFTYYVSTFGVHIHWWRNMWMILKLK